MVCKETHLLLQVQEQGQVQGQVQSQLQEQAYWQVQNRKGLSI
jgi:hypothetical protein